MAGLETNGSPQLELVRSFLHGIEKGDMDQVGKTMHKDHSTSPQFVAEPGQTKRRHLKHTGEVAALWTQGCEITIHSVMEAPGKVAVHLTGNSDTSTGVETVRDIVFIAHIVTDEDGSLKIKQGEEFTDSKAYLDFFKAVAEVEATTNDSPSAA